MYTHSWNAIQSERISHLPTEEDDRLVLERDTRIRERIVKSGKVSSNEEGEHPSNPVAPEARGVADGSRVCWNFSGAISAGCSVTISMNGGGSQVGYARTQRATKTYPMQEVAPFVNSMNQHRAAEDSVAREEPSRDQTALSAGVNPVWRQGFPGN